MSWNPFARKQIAIPPSDWWSKDIPQYTPDLNQLERKVGHLVFICDETMKAHFRHYIIKDATDTNVRAFTYDNLTLIKKDLGKASQVIPLTTRYAGAPYARIRGELYVLAPKQFIELDNYKLNGVQFQRVRVKLLIPYRKLSFDWWAKDKSMYEQAVAQTPFWDDTVEAWMYIGLKDYWDEKITQYMDDTPEYRRIKTTYRRIDGQFVKVLYNRQYRPVKAFEPNNKKMEKYYFYTTYHEFRSS